jgi:hypothetical protein
LGAFFFISEAPLGKGCCEISPQVFRPAVFGLQFTKVRRNLNSEKGHGGLCEGGLFKEISPSGLLELLLLNLALRSGSYSVSSPL